MPPKQLNSSNGAIDQDRINDIAISANGPKSGMADEPPLKSNLKRRTLVEEQVRKGRRKVTWPDADGKDLAHVQEFNSSRMEDGKFQGVGNSCVCVIQ